MQTKYWYVYRRWGNAPSFRHPSYEDALTEAKRLLDQGISGEYEILEAVALVKGPPKYVVEVFEITSKQPEYYDIPF